MAASGERVYPDLKTDFLETMFLSKNLKLNEIIKQIVDGEVEKNDDLYNLIRNNDWKSLDSTINETYSGRDKFFVILEQLFLFKYFLPEEDRISRKQFEIAMGIQQVRWMTDPENCRYKSRTSENTENGRIMNHYKVDKAIFYYWNDIPKEDRDKTIAKLNDQIGGRLFVKPINYEHVFSNTVWYKVDHVDKNTQKKKTIAWTGYGRESDFYPIPETLNISNIACVYQPKLVFGALSDESLLKFIIKYRQRPYVAHIPSSKSNLCDIHKSKHSIVAGWVHDFHHSRSNSDCSPRGVNWLNTSCKLNPALNHETIITAIDDPESHLIKCLEKDDRHLISRGANDSGMIFHDPPFPHFRGGAKRKTRRRRIQRRKSRHHRKSA
jgi:hypothetical protein